MPRWRYATWLLVIWTVLALIAIAAAAPPRVESEGWNAGDAYAGFKQATYIVLASIGWIVLGLIWLVTRPKPGVVLYGADGERVTVSEKEARRRVKGGEWTSQPPAPTPTDNAVGTGE